MLIRLRKELPGASVRVAIAELRNRKLIDAWARVSPATFYRFLTAQGLIGLSSETPKDRRRFEAELLNDLWQSDMMYGPMVKVEPCQRKAFLFAFLVF